MTVSRQTRIDPETGWIETWEREAGEGDWMLVSTQSPVRVAHYIQPDEPDHACRVCGGELDPRIDTETLWLDPLSCPCGARHTWSAEGGYGDDGSGWRWWVTGVVK